MNLETKILNYSDHLEDSNFIPNLSKEYGMTEIILKLEKMLSETPTKIVAALLFLRDASVHRKKAPAFNEVVDLFRKSILTSKIFSILEINMCSFNADIRYQTIYSFGKMCFPEQAFRLHKVIDFFAKKYPSELNRVLFEFFWLTGSVNYDILQRLINLNQPEIQKAIEEYLQTISKEEQAQIEKRIDWKQN